MEEAISYPLVLPAGEILSPIMQNTVCVTVRFWLAGDTDGYSNIVLMYKQISCSQQNNIRSLFVSK